MKVQVSMFIFVQKKFIKKFKKLSNYNEILIEEFIPGRNSGDNGQYKIRCNWVKTKRKFYDYKAKYGVKAKQNI